MKHLKRFNEEFLPELITIGMAFWMGLKLLKWLLGLSLNKLTRQIVSDVLKSAELHARSYSGKIDTKTNKISWEEGLKVAEFKDRYYVTMTGMFAKIPNFRVLKDEKKLILNAEKEQSQILDLTDEEYDQFLKIIKSKTEPVQEAIVEWETDNIKSFYNELEDKLSNLPKLKHSISFNDIKEVGDKHDIEVVDYDTFLNDLPTEQMKKDAPPRNVPAFGLVNPTTHKARIVLNTNVVDKGLLDYIYHMLKHENIHVGQKVNKKDKSKGEFLGDVSNVKSYFSNKDEVMAFAQSVSDMIMDMKPKDLEDAVKMIERTSLWKHIQKVDEKTKKRYKKYIYLYLEREFEKKGKGKEIPFSHFLINQKIASDNAKPRKVQKIIDLGINTEKR